MSIFEEVTLSWKGEDYKIPPDRIMGAIAKIEDVITLKELSDFAIKGDAPMAKMAIAYATVLRYAGAKVNEAEVYSAMFDVGHNTNILTCINALLTMMIPPKKDEELKKA